VEASRKVFECEKIPCLEPLASAKSRGGVNVVNDDAIMRERRDGRQALNSLTMLRIRPSSQLPDRKYSGERATVSKLHLRSCIFILKPAGKQCKENAKKCSATVPGLLNPLYESIHQITSRKHWKYVRQVFKPHDKMKITFAPAHRASYIKPCSSTSMTHPITIEAQS
jgi:hypothetical protein